MRWCLWILAVLAVTAAVNPASAVVLMSRSPMQRAAMAEVVIVGKVTAIEKEPVEVQPSAASPYKSVYKIAVVKVQTPLAGADNLTHLKIGFVSRPAAKPKPGPVPPRPGNANPELKENDEFLFFLTKHPDGGFYVMANMSPPIPIDTEDGKKALETVTKVTKLLADPMKGLKGENAEDRYLAAGALLTRYRNYPGFPGDSVDQTAIPDDESRLILKTLLERDWVKPDPSGISPTQLFFTLGLTDKDGWTMPKPQPGTTFNALLKDEFAKWLDGPGKDYRVKKMVPKK